MKYSDFYVQHPVISKYQIVDTTAKLKRLYQKMLNIEEFAFDTETNTLRVVGPSKDFKLVGISISWGEYNNYYIPVGHEREEDYNRNIEHRKLRKYMKRVFERTDVRIIGHNLKFDMHVMSRVGIHIQTKDLFDTMIVSWLCDENSPNGLKENSMLKMKLKQEHFAEVIQSVPSEVKKQFGLKASNKATFDLVLIDDGAPYALADAYYTWCLYLGGMEELEYQKMDKIFYSTYAKFLRTLYEMEEQGVTVDIDHLHQMKEEITKDKEDLLYQLYELAGCQLNINSNPALCELLFGYQKEVPDPRESDKWIYGRYTPKEKEKKIRDYEKKLVEKEKSLTMRYSFKMKPVSKTASGAPQANALSLMKLAKKEYKTKRKKEGAEFCKLLLQYKKLEKLDSAFIQGLEVQLYDDGKAHPSFNIIGTDSGRISCIEENTMITCVGGQKPIKDIKCGDLVYCYDDSGNLKISKVTGVFDNGYRDCVRLDWKSIGKHDTGHLICTPDHKILTRSGRWKEAKDLVKRGYGTKVYHLRRVKENRDRPVLYGANGLMEQEQLVIKHEYFNCTNGDMCIHHIDGDKGNNSVDNLTLMSKSEHTRYHSKKLVEEGRIRTDQLRVPHRVLSGKEHPQYKTFTSEDLEQMVHKAKGRIRDIPMDFDTFKKKCKEVNFDYKKVASQYQKQYSEPTEEEFIKAYQEHNGVAYKVREALNIGRVKYDKLLKKYDVCKNHEIINITPVGVMHVYDLEVEDYHNFIANEICVHNCSNPNLQQLPKADDEDKYQIRSLFIGSEYVADADGKWVSDDLDDFDEDEGHQIKRKKIIAGDYNNLEMRVLAHWSLDKNLMEMFETGSDTHSSTAVNMFELDCPIEEVKKKYPHLRQAAKVINFLLMYGGGAYTLYNNLKDDPWSPVDLGGDEYLEKYHVKKGEDVAQIYIDKYFDTYSGVTDFMEKQKRFAHKHGYVYTLLRRKRRLPDINGHDFKQRAYCERLSVNSCIQGSAADITMSGQNRIKADDWFRENGVNMILQIHDELVFEVPDDLVDEATARARRYMEHPFGDKVELHLPMLTSWDSGDSYQEAK